MPAGVDFVHFIYRVFGVLGSMLLIFTLLAIREIGWSLWFQMAIPISIILVIDYGITKRKPWLVIFLLFYASIAFLNSFIAVITPKPLTVMVVIFKSFSIILGIFYAAQLIIFFRKETRRFFKDKGQTLVA